MAQDFLSQLFGTPPDYSGSFNPPNQEQAQTNALSQGGLQALISLLGASGQTTRPVSTGQILGGALSAGLGGYQSSFDNTLRQMLAQGKLSDLQDVRAQRQRELATYNTAQTNLAAVTAAYQLPTPQEQITEFNRLGRPDLAKGIADTFASVRKSGILRPQGEEEAPSPFASYLTSASPEVRLQAQQFDTGFKSGRITEEMVDRLTPPLATMQASFNQNEKDRLDRQAQRAQAQLDRQTTQDIAAGIRADKQIEGKKPTESEQKASGFLQRMEFSTQIINELENKVLKEDGKVESMFPTGYTQALGGIPLVGDYLRTQQTSPIQQQYRQAQENWVRANLRDESGAVIGADEMQAEIRTYFPQPGESAKVIQQKRENRDVTQGAMKTAAGASYRPFDLKQFRKDRGLE